MSQGEQQIVCRHCRETIPLEGGNCPHCGASIRSTTKVGAAIAFGVLIAVGSLFQLSELWFFGLIGVAIVAISAYLLYDKRQRIQDATGETRSVSDITDEANG